MKFEQAKKLSDAWHNFDPELTLPMPEGQSYYVENPKSGVNKLLRKLLKDKGAKKYFICGHSGSGKSTELNKLAEDKQIRNKYTVLSYSLDQISDFATLNYMDFIVSIALKIKELKNPKNKKPLLDRKLIKELDDWFKTVTVEMDKKEGYKVETGIKFSAIFASFKGGLASRGSWRKHMKVVVEPRLTNLLSLLNHAANQVEKKSKKRLLVIIDNIEKADSGKVREIINNSFASITLPKFHIIYTLPISLRGDRETVIPRDILYVVPCIKIYKKGETNLSKLDSNAEAILREYIKKRMQPSLIEDKAVKEAILLSGGSFREMGRVLQLAIDFSEENNHNKILLEDVKKVRHEIVKSIQPLLRPDDYKILKQVLKNKEWLDGIDFMLQNLIVLEYENDELWLDVRQALIPYLQERFNNVGK